MDRWKKNKADKLKDELKKLRERRTETLKKSNDLFNLGGDGWHDNSAFHLMTAEVDKLSFMIEEIQEELRELDR